MAALSHREYLRGKLQVLHRKHFKVYNLSNRNSTAVTLIPGKHAHQPSFSNMGTALLFLDLQLPGPPPTVAAGQSVAPLVGPLADKGPVLT